jgi:hypothetical protein
MPIRQFASFPLKSSRMIQAEQANQSTHKPLTHSLFGISSTHSLVAPALFLAVFLAVFILYTLTLAPGVVGGDAGEHQFAAPLLGIPHTTGYPLYVLVSKLWTLLIPIGSLAWRMNLFSALGGALAAAITALVVYRLSQDVFYSTVPRPALWAGAVAAGFALSFGLTLWQWSVMAGVRSFNVFFFALITLEAIIWAQQRRRGDDKAAVRTLRWLAFTVGLSLAHHRTTIFYLPSLVGWVWWHDRQLFRQPRRMLNLVLLGTGPLILYAFIYLRGINGPPYTHEPITDLQSFWFLVGSGDSTGLFFSIDPTYLPARLLFIWRDSLIQLSLPGVILALAGGVILLRRRPDHFIFQALLIAILLLFTLDFEVVNLNEAPTWYLMPAYFILAIWLGIAVNGLLDYSLRLTPSRFQTTTARHTGHNALLSSPLPPLSSLLSRPSSLLSRHSSVLLQLLVITLVIAVLIFALGRPNWHSQAGVAIAPLDDWRQILRGTQAQRFVESSLPYVEPDSIIWGDWEQYTPLRYYQLINGLRPDVTARNPLDRWPEKVAAAHARGQPIYFSRKPPDLIGTPYLSMVGPLIYLGREPQFEEPPDIVRLDASFENELELIGYRAQIWPQFVPGAVHVGLDLLPLRLGRETSGERHSAKTKPADSMLQLTLYWRVPHRLQQDYALSLRLNDRAGQEFYRKDAIHPVLSSYPTSLWTPGEVVGDFHELPLPADRAPITLLLLPYRTEGPGVWHNLILSGSDPPQAGIRLGPFVQ